jgi:uncharacterized short protein YbdD (DUF466 family)
MRETDKGGNGKGGTGKVNASAQTYPLSRFTFPRLRRLVSTARQVFGMPDYQRYLEHQRDCHPDEPVLSRKEHYLAFVERRYAGGGSRCC